MITYNQIGNYGRFGNQLFQYATLYSIAKTRKYKFGVPYKKRSANEYNDFCLSDCFDSLSAEDSSEVQSLKHAKEHNFSYNAGIFGIPDNTDICGYFQSEKYFVNYRTDLLKEFTFKKHIMEKAELTRNLTNKNAISVHIRLGDYLFLQNSHPVCSMEYYEEALSILPDDLLIFIFSDEPEKADKIFNKLNRQYVLVDSGCKYIDMATMSLCEYHVIANSSFSWWGSWLSDSKKTIAPSKWFGDAPSAPKDWRDIYCKEWIII